jgi:hypothetical protein
MFMSLTRWAAGLAAILVAGAALGAINTDPPAPDGNALAEGVYFLKFEGPGRKVTLTDGSEAILGKPLPGQPAG